MSNSLLPLYNSILTYKQQSKDDRDEDLIVDDVMNQYGSDKHKYLRFVLFPEIYPPCRPPAVFPHPTHIFRDIGSLNLTASGGGLFMAWAPFLRSGGNNLLVSQLTTWNATNAITNTGLIGGTVTGEVENTYSPPSVTGIDTEHIRGLAAYLQVTYIGRLDELAGIIEVGVALDDDLNQNNSAATRYVTTSSLKGLYQYKKMDVSQGVRCVYLPLSIGAFDHNGVKNAGALNQVYHIHISGASTSSGVFRVDYGYYYDGVVDETGYNTLLPQKPPKSYSSREDIIKTVHENHSNAAITPANPADTGVVSSIWNSVRNSLANNLGSVANFMVGEGVNIFRDARSSFIK